MHLQFLFEGKILKYKERVGHFLHYKMTKATKLVGYCQQKPKSSRTKRPSFTGFPVKDKSLKEEMLKYHLEWSPKNEKHL